MFMKKTHEQFIYEVKNKNDKVIIISKYTKAHDYIKVKCKRCGNEWEAKAYSLLSGRACPKCRTIRGVENNRGKTKKKTNNEFIEELEKIDNSIKVESQYISHHGDVKCLCKRCGNRWEAKAYSLLQGHGCPRCARSGTSFMEQFIRLSFIKKISENDVISRDRKTIGMELDIVIPKLKIAFEPGNWQLHKKNILRDDKKRKKCKEKGIRLITIYDRFPKSEIIPFKSDCIVNENDFNKADHSEIKGLIHKLFTICNLECDFNDNDWNEIETQAYLLSKSKTHEDFINEMYLINPNIKIIGTYENSSRRIHVKCQICGYEWNGVPANMLSGDGCRKCGTKKAHEKVMKNTEWIKNELKKIESDVEIIGEYRGRHNPIKARCKICGYEWEPMASSLLRGANHKDSKTIHNSLKK